MLSTETRGAQGCCQVPDHSQGWMHLFTHYLQNNLSSLCNPAARKQKCLACPWLHAGALMGVKQARGEGWILHFFYRIGMIGSPHSEKTDEKIERVENHKKKKLQGQSAFHGEMEGSICLACQQEKWEITCLQCVKCFPRQKILGSHHFSQLAKKDNRIQWLKAGASQIRLEIRPRFVKMPP